ncbi:Mitosis inhibitor protein kinase wee1 [Perkinsus olseni]|uniref:Mitosis inhibitor protein kinase wee1 n=1 Tax=Perkinsus olseni TaxID=32597 RepID=A0A7J6U455_PEROL|nr:Mitosis inhibitor protein kinase wee1 [Perkinsus olseni]
MLHSGTREDSGGVMLAGRTTPAFCAGFSRRRARSFDEDPIEVPNVERLWSQTPIEQHAVPVEGMPSAGDFFIHRASLAGCSSPTDLPFGRNFSKDCQPSPGERLRDPGPFRVAIPSLPLSQSSMSSSGAGGCDSARSCSSFLSLPTSRILSASHSTGHLELCNVGSGGDQNVRTAPRRARLRRSDSEASLSAWGAKQTKENLPRRGNNTAATIPDALARKDSVVGTTYAWFPASSMPHSAATNGGSAEPLCTPHVPSATPLSLPPAVLTRRGSANSIFTTYPGTPIVAQTPHTHILTNQRVLKHPPASVRLQRMLLERGGRDFPAPTVYHGHEVKRRRIGRASDCSRLHDEFRGFKKIGEGSFAEVLSVESRLDGQRWGPPVSSRLAPDVDMQSSDDFVLTVDGVKRRSSCGKHVLALISHSVDIFDCETSASASHITRYFGCWFEDDRLHIQTELCEESLTAEVERTGRLPSDKLTVVLRDIGSALKFLHVDMHIAHKDVKPDNVLRITTNGCGSKYKLCDFGLATSIHENSEASSDLGSGDARYLPREMLSCHADRPLGNDMTKVDIFSLGASALECGIGHGLPPNGDQWQSLRDGNLPFKEMDQLPSKLTELIKAMLSPAPEARPDAETILAKLKIP